jgi:PAS domain S-box-containing protein
MKRLALTTSLHKLDRKIYENLLGVGPVGFYEINFYANRLLDVDDVACQVSGYSREELLSMSPLELFQEESVFEFHERMIRKVGKRRLPSSVRYHVISKDRIVKEILVHAAGIKYRGVEPESVIVAFVDITKKQ